MYQDSTMIPLLKKYVFTHLFKRICPINPVFAGHYVEWFSLGIGTQMTEC